MVPVKIALPIFLLSFFVKSSEAQISNPLYELFLRGFLNHSVDFMSVQELEQKQDSVLILDTRQSEEYKVSHIPGAKWVGYDDFTPDKVNDIAKDTPVALYCSVGYRSEKIGEQMKDMGFENVYNLHGGIFEWTNQKMPLVKDDSVQTNQIHPYSSTWGIWLSHGEKTYE